VKYLGHEFFSFQDPGKHASPVWWINAVILPLDLQGKAEEIGMALVKFHPFIEVRPGFYPLNEMKPFKATSMECPHAKELYERVVCLPSSARLTEEDVKLISKSFIEIVQQFSN
jgi:dTDP-4-amino-4,6-dideoxygalactose transaminase